MWGPQTHVCLGNLMKPWNSGEKITSQMEVFNASANANFPLQISPKLLKKIFPDFLGQKLVQLM